MRKLVLSILILLTMIPPLWAAKVICTAYPLWLLTRTAAGNASGELQIILMTPPQQGCIHNYTPAVRDLVHASAPDALLIANGLGLDDHIVHAVKKVNPKIRIVYVADQQDKFDPHYFIAPGNACFMIKNIAAVLSQADPGNHALYQANAQKVIQQLKDLSAQYSALPGKKYVLLQSMIFAHLAKAANRKIILLKKDHNAILTAYDLKKLLQELKQKKPYAVWVEKNTHDPALAMVQKNHSLVKIELDNMMQGPADPPAGYLLQVMRSNLEALKKAD